MNYAYQATRGACFAGYHGVTCMNPGALNFKIYNTKNPLSDHVLRLCGFDTAFNLPSGAQIQDSVNSSQNGGKISQYCYAPPQESLSYNAKSDAWGLAILFAELMTSNSKERSKFRSEKKISPIRQSQSLTNDIIRSLENQEKKEPIMLKLWTINAMLQIDQENRVDIFSTLRFLKCYESIKSEEQLKNLIQEQVELSNRRAKQFNQAVILDYIQASTPLDFYIHDPQVQTRPSSLQFKSSLIPYLSETILHLYDTRRGKAEKIQMQPLYQGAAITYNSETQQLVAVGGSIKSEFKSSHYLFFLRDERVLTKIERNLPIGRAYASVAFLSDDSYSVVGGLSLPCYSYQYNRRNANWEEGPPLRVQRLQPCVVKMKNYVYILGGSASAIIERRNIENWGEEEPRIHWKSEGVNLQKQLARSHANAVVLDQCHFVLFGGLSDQSCEKVLNFNVETGQIRIYEDQYLELRDMTHRPFIPLQNNQLGFGYFSSIERCVKFASLSFHEFQGFGLIEIKKDLSELSKLRQQQL